MRSETGRRAQEQMDGDKKKISLENESRLYVASRLENLPCLFADGWMDSRSFTAGWEY